MKHYAVVQVVIEDADGFNEYRQMAGKGMAKHGVTMLAGGPESVVLEDNGAGATTNVVLEFPSRDVAEAWINDPDLADTHAKRRSTAKTTIVLLPGG